MQITLIVAMAENRAIGINNAMPWHLPDDLRRFRSLTTGHPILMGRKTHEAIGRPLPGRRNLVMTRQVGLDIPGCEVVRDMDALEHLIGETGTLFVIGGAELYQLFLPVAQRIELTIIHQTFEGDTFFPMIDPSAWEEVARTEGTPDSTLDFTWSYVTLDRVA